MARIARVVVPGLPHHVTQRGNRRQPVFFGAADYRLYRRLVGQAARRAGAEIWAYCLLPNHVDLIVAPADAADYGGQITVTVYFIRQITVTVYFSRRPVHGGCHGVR